MCYIQHFEIDTGKQAIQWFIGFDYNKQVVTSSSRWQHDDADDIIWC
jgi:hypothetical protein